MNGRSIAPGKWMLAAIGALAFVLACVAHEAVGHGGACLLSGSRITRLSSVYFRCSNGNAITDAAGPMMNLIVGLACWAMLKARPTLAMNGRIFLLLGMAFNLLWGTGYFILTAVTVGGDWAFLLRDLAPAPQALARVAMGAVGLIAYRRVRHLLASMWPPRVSLLVPYFAAGIVVCASTPFFHGAILPALREAAIEGFGSAVALPLIALHRSARNDAAAPEPAQLEGGIGWIVMASIVCIVFFATLGRGYGLP